ncbi:MAG: DsbA family protein [Hyphomicrobiaceae bacterium]
MTELRRHRLQAAITAAALAAVTFVAAPAALRADDKAVAPAGQAAASSFSPAQKSEIEKIIKDYLIANPEVFLEIQQALEDKMEQAQAAKMKDALAKHAETLFRDPDAPVAGDPKGDVTVVEFFDYNCGYCKRGFSDLAQLIKDDPKVRVVFRELPILSKGSEEAAQVALAARMQGKYWEFHSAMIVHKGQADMATALKIAEKAGLDMNRLKADLKSPKVQAEIDKVRELAQTLGINGTPHFIVGNKSIPGAPQDLLAQLKSDIAEMRKNGCGTIAC